MKPSYCSVTATEVSLIASVCCELAVKSTCVLSLCSVSGVTGPAGITLPSASYVRKNLSLSLCGANDSVEAGNESKASALTMASVATLTMLGSLSSRSLRFE